MPPLSITAPPLIEWQQNLIEPFTVRPIPLLLLALTLLLLAVAPAAQAQVRIKDIVDVEGVRENQLVGYGLMVGLNGTGDKLNNNIFTLESLVGMLERLG